MEKNNKRSLLTVLMNLAVNKALKAKQVHLLTVFTSLCFYSGLKVKMGGNVSTSELIAPTMRSSLIVLLTCSTLRMTWMRHGNIACFLPLPPHPSAEKDNFSPASPTLTLVVGRSSPGAGRRWAGATRLQGGQGDCACCQCGGAGGRAVLNPYATASPACARGNAVALAVSCRRWVGASR